MPHDLAGSSIGASRSALSPPDARVHLFHRSVSISNRIHFGSRLQRKSGKQHLMAGTKDVWAGSRIHSEASVNVASTQLFHGRFFPWYACGTFISSGYGTLDSWVLFLCYRNFSREIADIHGISIFVIALFLAIYPMLAIKQLKIIKALKEWFYHWHGKIFGDLNGEVLSWCRQSPSECGLLFSWFHFTIVW